MAQQNLTDLFIQKLKPEEKQYFVWDTQVPSFGIRVSPKSKTFVVYPFKNGKKTLRSVGRYPELSLKEARQKGKAMLLEDALPEKEKSHNYADVVKEYIVDAKRRLKPETYTKYERHLEAFGFDGDLSEITKVDIKRYLERYIDTPSAGNLFYATLKAFLNWCVEQDYIETHPIMVGKRPFKTTSRNRVLSDEELARVWKATGTNGFSRIIRMAILTGQRRTEVRNIKPEDIRDGYITFHCKGGRTNQIPILPLMERELAHVPFRFCGDWAHSKLRFDKQCGVDFRIHDLRRTLASRLPELGVDVITVETILNHSLGGVMGIYNRYNYAKEVHKALLTWEAHIRKIASLDE